MDSMNKGDKQVSNGKKPGKKPEQPAEVVEEAVIVSGDAPDADALETPAEPQEAAEPAVDQTPSEDSAEEAPADGPVLIGEPFDPEEETPEPEAEAELEAEEEPVQASTDPVVTPVAPLPPEQVVVKQGGFLPLFLGGVVAAGIGFAVARYVLPAAPANDGIEAALSGPKKDIADLATRIDGLESGPDMSGITGQIDETRSALSGQIDSLTAELGTLKSQLDELASRPNMAGSATEAVAAYEAQMEKLRTEVQAMTDAASAEKAAAEMTEREAMLRNSVTRVRIALDEGTPFADALANIDAGGMVVPDALTATAQSGVPTLTQLQTDFPDAARAALAASRKGADGGQTAGSVMSRILGTRSLEPREGNDPDAVLSRAEAALKEARLADTLAELDALPEAAQAELAEWTANATQRTAALAAADALGQELNKD